MQTTIAAEGKQKTQVGAAHSLHEQAACSGATVLERLARTEWA